MKIARLGVIVFSVLVVLGMVACSNPAGNSGPSSHTWYYTVSVTTGTQAYVSYCINSTGGMDSPGTVTTPWSSSTYTTSGSNPAELIVLAWLPTGVTGSITANIYEDGNQVATQTTTGTSAIVNPAHIP